MSGRRSRLGALWVGRPWAYVIAGLAVVAATTLMWSDAAITVWGSMIAFAMGVQPEATTTVMEVRTWGDADLHVLVWGCVAVLLITALPGTRSRLIGAAGLLTWTAFVEIAQPWLTEQRSRQWTDLLGNVLGIVGALCVVFGFVLVPALVKSARERAGRQRRT